MTNLTWWMLDGMLIGALLLLAGAALHSRSLRHAVILFIAFGLTAALVWARLRAPDVALAEAAIGAGLAGALMLAALRDIPADEVDGTAQHSDEHAGPWTRGLITLAAALLAVGMGWALWFALQKPNDGGLAAAVTANIGDSGVSNPVTAVLLNFRAFDTLLELAVLLAALLGILSLGPSRPSYRPAGPVVDGLLGWLVPLLIVTGGYLLWVGAHAPGGAFQAGALLAAAGVILYLAGRPQAGLPRGLALRLIAVAGVGVFMLVGLATLWGGPALLAYRGATAGGLILLIEVFATLSIAATLVLSYVGGQPDYWVHAARDGGS